MIVQRLITKLLSAYLNGLTRVAPRLAEKHAFYVFCYPFAVKLKPSQEAFLDTAEQGSIDFEGTQINTYKWGNGEETILMVHGWQSNAFRWKKFVETFDMERYTLIAFDAPGHGRSGGRILNVPMYAQVLKQIIESEARIDHIITHSIGGFALLYAYHSKIIKEAKSLTLLAPPGNAQEFFEYFIEMLGISPRLEKNLRRFFKEYVGEEVEYFTTPNFAVEVQAPTLIIHDKEDRDTAYTHSKKLNQALPHSELMLTEGFGHKLRDISVVEASVNHIAKYSKQKELLSL